MTISRLAPLRLVGAASLALAVSVALAACSGDPTIESPTPAASSAAPTSSETPSPTPTPTPTPAPTARFTNEPDDELAALIPATAGGAAVTVAPFDEFALTPGDVGAAYGEIGDRFASLVIAYITQPRTSLYAMRVDGDPVTTEELEPHLAAAGRYVGIAGLDPEPWELVDVEGTLAWMRPEDNATAAGTTIYTWSSGELVFLLIGVDDAVNRALVGGLPGEPAPTPSPTPRVTPSPSPGEASPSATIGDG